MKIEVLWTLKAPNGQMIPKGIYSDKTEKGIPDVVISEAKRGANTVRLLSGKLPTQPKPQAASKNAKDEAVTLQDTSVGTTTMAPPAAKASVRPDAEVAQEEDAPAVKETKKKKTPSSKRSKKK
jgi:microcystin-dependent protein